MNIVTQSIVKNTKKDKQVLMLVNIAHTLNFISKNTSLVEIFKKASSSQVGMPEQNLQGNVH